VDWLSCGKRGAGEASLLNRCSFGKSLLDWFELPFLETFREFVFALLLSGLQGSYNAFTKKRGLRVPNGDVLVFALAYVFISTSHRLNLNISVIRCGQIVYAFLLRQDTLPRSYISWYSKKISNICTV